MSHRPRRARSALSSALPPHRNSRAITSTTRCPMRDRLLILLTGAWCCITLICVLLLAESIYFLLVLSFAAWKQYAVLDGQLPARRTEVAKQFGITPLSPD